MNVDINKITETITQIEQDVESLYKQLVECNKIVKKSASYYKPAREAQQGLHKTPTASAIRDILTALGAEKNMLGYVYLMDAIEIAIDNYEGWAIGITKYVYPLIAKRHKTTAAAVERNIRSEIQAIYENENLNLLLLRRVIGGVDINNSKNLRRKSNSQFIAALADYIENNIIL